MYDRLNRLRDQAKTVPSCRLDEGMPGLSWERTIRGMPGEYAACSFMSVGDLGAKMTLKKNLRFPIRRTHADIMKTFGRNARRGRWTLVFRMFYRPKVWQVNVSA